MHDAQLPDIDDRDLDVQPLERAETIPASWYVDPRFHRFDCEEILARHWQYVGHVAQAASPGDHFVADVLGNPILVVRDRRSALNCFYNVCRHRGGPLATENGRSSKLVCKYHAWSYDLDGTLTGTPRFDGVENFDKCEYGLTPVRSAVCDGLIFVDVSGAAAPIEDYLGGIRERIAPVTIERMQFVERVVYEAKCNWKAYVDNFLEGYHLLPVHPELSKIIDVKGYATEVRGNQILQSTTINARDNPYHAEQGGAYYYFVFPNLMLNVLPTRLQLNAVIPVKEDECITIFDYFYLDADGPSVQAVFEDDHKLSDHVQQQDLAICERVQQGLASNGYNKGRFSVAEEKGVHAFQALLKRAYRHALARRRN